MQKTLSDSCLEAENYFQQMELDHDATQIAYQCILTSIALQTAMAMSLKLTDFSSPRTMICYGIPTIWTAGIFMMLSNVCAFY